MVDKRLGKNKTKKVVKKKTVNTKPQVKRKKKKRKVKKGFVVFCVIVVLALIAIPAILSFKESTKFDGYKSQNPNSGSIVDGNCIAFFPNSSSGRDYAKNLCEPYKDNKDVTAIDYTLTPKGDYYVVKYNDEHSYLIDKDNNRVENIDLNDNVKIIISDYLRYQMKSKEIDEAYTSKFLEDTYYENLNLNDCKFKFNDDNLDIYFPKYNENVDVPLKYLQKDLGMNFGYDDEMYVRLHYVSPTRKKIAITFDDGPVWKVTNKIMNTLYKYDSVGTFFTLGWRLGEDEINLIKESISKGNEYASHTESHPNLTECSNTVIYNEVMQPYNVLKDSFGYEMKNFRPPFGRYNDNVLKQVPLKAVLWNVDSEDWTRSELDQETAANETTNHVLSTMREDAIILMHDIYPNSAAALEKLVPALIDNGYQLVTVSELKESLGKTEDNPFR